MENDFKIVMTVKDTEEGIEISGDINGTIENNLIKQVVKGFLTMMADKCERGVIEGCINFTQERIQQLENE